jgi:hypothetical protein
LLPGFEFRHRIPDVGLRNDSVALEYTSRLPAADLHNYTLGDAGPAKIPSSRPPQIMKEQARFGYGKALVRRAIAEGERPQDNYPATSSSPPTPGLM